MTKITATATMSNDRPPASMQMPEGSNSWRVYLRYQGRTLTVPFFTGPAISTEPTAADVIECIAADASSVENMADHYEWCDEYGMTPSRDTEQTYQACVKLARRLRRFLGDDYGDVVYPEHDLRHDENGFVEVTP